MTWYDKIGGSLIYTHGDHTQAPSQRKNSPPRSFAVCGGRLQLVRGARTTTTNNNNLRN